MRGDCGAGRASPRHHPPIRALRNAILGQLTRNQEQRFLDEGGFAGQHIAAQEKPGRDEGSAKVDSIDLSGIIARLGGLTVKKSYSKPVLVKKGKLSQVTAVANGAGSGPVE